MIQALILGLAAILIGLICCYSGYGVWRIALVIGGFILGYEIGHALIIDTWESQWFLALLLGIAFSLVVGLLAYFLWSISIVLAGAVFGAAGGAGLALAINARPDGLITIAFAVVGLVIGLVLALLLKDLLVVVVMALAGASAVVFGIVTILPFLEFLENPQTIFGTAIRIIVIGVLALTGIGAQLKLYGPRFDGDLYFEEVG
ncbi:MAG: hypothetical protein UZ15_CFX003000592 [Chloroflexi bacterium OLB15]|nr:MAG: hypothetical protein UZ15_CFX003000592 [Chloroflexi bacterium OLB15]